MRAPCRDCPDRKPGTKDSPSCHAACERYLAYWRQQRGADKQRLDDMRSDDLHYRGVEKSIRIRRAMKGKLRPND